MLSHLRHFLSTWLISTISKKETQKKWIRLFPVSGSPKLEMAFASICMIMVSIAVSKSKQFTRLGLGVSWSYSDLKNPPPPYPPPPRPWDSTHVEVRGQTWLVFTFHLVWNGGHIPGYLDQELPENSPLPTPSPDTALGLQRACLWIQLYTGGLVKWIQILTHTQQVL